MKKDMKLNANRFKGFADIYDNARPECPQKIKEILLNYLNRTLSLVVDIGCGTGLSTVIWSEVSSNVIGVEPSEDMIKLAREKSVGLSNVEFISAFSNNTGIQDNSADIVTCSQAFHWMNPESTINEVARILKPGGIFATYDCDWPPVCNFEAELEYEKLFQKVSEIEAEHSSLKNGFEKWDKDKHLSNIKNSNKFRFTREVVFLNRENCDAERFINIALSQGGLQAIIKEEIAELDPFLETFKERIVEIFGASTFEIDFCYRMRIGIK